MGLILAGLVKCSVCRILTDLPTLRPIEIPKVHEKSVWENTKPDYEMDGPFSCVLLEGQ